MKEHVLLLCTIALAVAVVALLASEESRTARRVLGLSAVCMDGALTTSPRGPGVCAAHGGVKEWMR